LESVQVQYAVDRQLDGAIFVHGRILPVNYRGTRERVKAGE
jgi:hypothetical protein